LQKKEIKMEKIQIYFFKVFYVCGSSSLNVPSKMETFSKKHLESTNYEKGKPVENRSQQE
jgi:hypothetical protein